MPDLIRIASADLSADISAQGAEMQSLATQDGRQWLWHGDAAFWSGRSPVLFPIVGKAPDDTLVVDGKAFPMGQHGFARRSAFALAAQNETMVRFELAASQATKAVYPFDFLLAIEHSITGRSLTLASEVTNRGTSPMPFQLGYHSAFAWPLPGAADRAHHITLTNGGAPKLARLTGGLLQATRQPSPFAGGSLLLDHELFAEDAMIFPEGAGTALTYAAQGGPEMTFTFENLPNLALWTKPGAPFLCIEPWHGMAAEIGGSTELAARPCAVTLPPGTTARFAFTVEIAG